MKMAAAVCFLLAMPALVAWAADAPTNTADTVVTLGGPVPATVLRGGQVSVSGSNLPRVSTVSLCSADDPKCEHGYLASAGESTKTSLKFTIPPKQKPGIYRVGIGDAGNPPTVFTASPIEVTRDTPTISALSDSTLYPTGINEPTYSAITIQGTGFAVELSPKQANSIDSTGHKPDQEKNEILINDVPVSECDPDSGRYCSRTFKAKSSNETTIVVSGLPRALAGKVNLSVKIGNSVSLSKELLLSGAPRYAPRLVATAILVMLILLAWWGAAKKVEVPLTSPTARIRQWKTIFIDFDSNTYSLSRLQLVIWTFVALFGWIYLSVARSMIQGMVTFSDIPSGLPGVLLVSVGTSIAATGVGNIKGGKSSGPFSPSLSDFYSVGGIIAPERAQFFLWTIVGAVGFIVFTLALDPAKIQDLPTLPDGFLQLAGISAFGYVGGKAVRKTGPILKGVAGVKDSAMVGKVTWTLTGSGLAKNARFAYKVGDGKTAPTEAVLGKAEVTAEDFDQDGDAMFFKKLTVVMTDTPSAALPPEPPAPGDSPASVTATPFPTRLFVIINPDGQRAEWPY